MPSQDTHEEQSVQRAGEACAVGLLAVRSSVGQCLLMLGPTAAQIEIQEDRSDRHGPSKVESRM